MLQQVQTDFKLHVICSQPVMQSLLKDNYLRLKRYIWALTKYNIVQPFNLLGVHPKSMYTKNIIHVLPIFQSLECKLSSFLLNIVTIRMNLVNPTFQKPYSVFIVERLTKHARSFISLINQHQTNSNKTFSLPISATRSQKYGTELFLSVKNSLIILLAPNSARYQTTRMMSSLPQFVTLKE